MRTPRAAARAGPSGAVGLALVLLLPAVAALDGPVAIEGRFIVGFDRMPGDLEVGDAFHGGVVVDINPALSFAVVETPNALTFPLTVRQESDVVYVEEDAYRQWVQLVPNDPRYSSQYGPSRVRAPEAWDATTGSSGRNVCIVDTGVRYTHEDIAGPRWLGGVDEVNNDADPWDDHGHGTHVAGTAAATIGNGKGIAGIANVGIYAAKVLDGSGSGFTSWVADGITWCADNGGSVVSLSLGSSSPSTTLRNAVDYAWAAGQVVVAAAGNDGPCSNCVSYPAAYANAIAVACTTSSDAQCWFSSAGPEVDVAAPGDGILSTYRSSDTSYVSLSGTSMSTPHVSGVAALIWSRAPASTNAEIRAALERTAGDLGAPGLDPVFGKGIVDAKRLLDEVAPELSYREALAERFDDGVADAFTLTGLWHVDSTCSSPPSLPNYLGYHRTTACNYDTPPFANAGTADVTADLSEAFAALLTFRHRWVVEQTKTVRDTMLLQTSTDAGATWTTLRHWDARAVHSPEWRYEVISINASVGGPVVIRFSFNTQNALENAHEGWFVDDLVVLKATNRLPVAVAGPDILLADADASGDQLVTLDGRSSSDPDGSIVSAEWRIAGVPVATGLLAQATLPVGTHSVVLVVTDDDGDTRSDAATVTIQPARPPLAVALDALARDADGTGSELIVLDGSASVDPDGVVAAYAWTENATVLSTVAAPTLAFPVGSRAITLQVTDDAGLTASRTIDVTVAPNRPPVADFKYSCGPASCRLDGRLSADPEGTVVAHAWTFGDGGTGTGAVVDHAYAEPGTYLVTLTVTDDGGMTASATLTINTIERALLTESFDDGIAQGFTMSGLWRLNATCTSTPTPRFFAAYLASNRCDYAVGSRSTGSMDVDVDLRGTELAYLRFDHRYVTDQSATRVEDIRSLMVRNHTSGAWSELLKWDARSPNQASWRLEEVDLRSFAGNVVTVRFFFDSVDAGSLGEQGWNIDNILVTSGGRSTPAARAGSDVEVRANAAGLANIPLDGSASYDVEGTLASLRWLVAGETVATGTLAQVQLPLGIHQVTLVVTDEGGLIATDDLQAVVLPNRLPIADAGPDQRASDRDGDGVAVFQLDGTRSRDPDGPLASWEWSLAGAPVGSGPFPLVTFPVGTHVLTLVVADSVGATASDTIELVVDANLPPVARAGADATSRDVDGSGEQTLLLPDAGSADQDGGTIEHQWWVDGNLVASTRDLSHSFAVGLHGVTKIVRDEAGAEAADSLVVTVLPNEQPLLFTTVDCSDLVCVFDATGTRDPDGVLAGITWTFSDGTTSSATVLERTFDAPGEQAWSIEARDNGGAVATRAGIARVEILPPRGPVGWSQGVPHTQDAHTGRQLDVAAADVEAAWFESDARYLYVGLKVRNLEGGGDLAHLTHTVAFRPTWTIPDKTWGGKFSGTLDRLRVEATHVMDQATGEHVPAYRLVGVSTSTSTHVLAQVEGTHDAGRDVVWWVVPRTALQSPDRLAVLTSPSASSLITFPVSIVRPVVVDSTEAGASYTLAYRPRTYATAEMHRFDHDMHGFLKRDEQAAHDVSWDPARGGVQLTSVGGPGDELMIRRLPSPVGPANSFSLSARFAPDTMGQGPSVTILHLGNSTHARARGAPDLARIGYEPTQGLPFYVFELRDSNGIVRARTSLSPTAPGEVTVGIDYAAETSTLTYHLSRGGIVLAQKTYVLVSPKFAFDQVGFGADASAVGALQPLTGKLDDVLVRTG